MQVIAGKSFILCEKRFIEYFCYLRIYITEFYWFSDCLAISRCKHEEKVVVVTGGKKGIRFAIVKIVAVQFD